MKEKSKSWNTPWTLASTNEITSISKKPIMAGTTTAAFQPPVALANTPKAPAEKKSVIKSGTVIVIIDGKK